MGAVVHPTVLLPVGQLGREAISRLGAAVDLDHPLLEVVDPLNEGGGDRLASCLDGLLRVGREGARTTEPRLDLLVIVDLTEPEAGRHMHHVAVEISNLIANRYGRVFPADLPPEQRTAALHVLAVMPALAATDEARRALRDIALLERWAESREEAKQRLEAAGLPLDGLDEQPRAPHPVLARIWLAPTQTAAGVLKDDDVASTAAGFALACLVAGLRDEEPVRRRMAHPRPGDGRIGFVAVATLDVPLGRVLTYARTRAAFDALDAVVDRVQRRVVDGALALDQLGPLASTETLKPFLDGDEARQLRELAWRLAGGAELPERISVGPFESAEQLRGRFSELYGPAISGGSGTSHTERGALDAALGSLERAEGIAHTHVHHQLEQLASATLGGVHRLDRLPEVEAGLGHLIRRLEDEQTRDRAAASSPPGPVGEEGLAELVAATSALPEPDALRGIGAAVGVGIGFLTVAISMSLLAGGQSSTTTLSATNVVSTATTTPTMEWTAWLPWLLGVGVGSLAAWALARVAGQRSREGVLAALETRRDALRALKERGTGAASTRRAEASLRLHRLRARRDGITALTRMAERLRTIRAALVAARDDLSIRLGALGIQPAADPEQDDLSPLLSGGTRLHKHLVGTGALRRWLSRARRYADRDAWADRVLERTWPADGLAADVPGADLDAVLDASGEQMELLNRRSLFDDEEASREAANNAAEFARRVMSSLAPGCTPRTPYGDAAPGVRSGELLTVGPVMARHALEEALLAADVHLGARLWAEELEAPRLIFVRTWEGHTTAEVCRGAGVEPC